MLAATDWASARPLNWLASCECGVAKGLTNELVASAKSAALVNGEYLIYCFHWAIKCKIYCKNGSRFSILNHRNKQFSIQSNPFQSH